MIRSVFILALALPATIGAAFAASPEHAVDTCTPAKGVECTVECKRSLGEQCLITHVRFNGMDISSGTELWKANFLTCKNANIDLQLVSVSTTLGHDATNSEIGTLSVEATSTETSFKLRDIKLISDKKRANYARLSRIPFKELLNSGDSHVSASLKLEKCGSEKIPGLCTISGRLVATTDPNIRCEFHDTSDAGAFRPPSLLTSPGGISNQHPVGRIGPQ